MVSGGNNNTARTACLFEEPCVFNTEGRIKLTIDVSCGVGETDHKFIYAFNGNFRGRAEGELYSRFLILRVAC